MGIPCLSCVHQALQRLKRATNQLGHLRLLRNRKTFENNHDKQIRKKKESLQRQARARRTKRAAERL
jgi:ribosomal protein S21